MERHNIGDIIRENRSKQRLTQKELGEQLNVTDKAVSKWERNIARPDISTIPKLAQILEIPVTELLNLPDVENMEEKQDRQEENLSETETERQTDEACLYYENRRSKHLRLLILQGIGAVLGLIAVITEDCTLLERLAGLLVMPLACAGFLRFFVRTFQIVRMKLGRKIYDDAGNYYVVPRNGLGVVGCFVAFGLFTCILTGFAHVEYAADVIMVMMGIIEVFLLYTDIRIVRTEGKGGINLKITIAFVAIMLVLSAVLAVMWFSAPDKADTETDTAESLKSAEHQPRSATNFDEISSEYEYICEKASNFVLEEENRQREYGYEIVIPGSLKAAYFLSALDPDVEYFDVGSGTSVANAIIVVGHYNVNIWNTSPRDEWLVMVFPNFTIDVNGTVSYDESDEYCDYLTKDSLEDLYEWLSDEYDEMSIVQLDLPQS